MTGTRPRTGIRRGAVGACLTACLLAAAPLAGLAPGALAADPTARVSATSPDGRAVFNGTISFQAANRYTLAGTLSYTGCNDGPYATVQPATANAVHSVAGRAYCGSISINQPITEAGRANTAWATVCRTVYDAGGEHGVSCAETAHIYNPRQ